MTLRQARKLLGTYINTRPFIAGIPDVELEVDEASLPSSFDWRKQGNCVHAIRNQEQCGSCWAFAATEALSDRFCISSKGSKLPVSQYPKGLSPENLVSCDTQNMGCNGGYLQYAWAFMVSPGVVTNQCYPYNAGGGTPGPCVHQCQNGGQWTPYKVQSGTVQHVMGVPSIQQNLMTDGPQEVAFTVYEDFFHYESGVYQHQWGGVAGGHAVKFIGWGFDSSSNLPYWIVANSWGTSWAQLGGFFWIRKGVNECGIESQVYAGTPDLSSGY
jgi:cathepsin B